MTKQRPLRLLVDGVVFSNPDDPEVSMWEGVLRALSGRHSVFILDRGNTPSFTHTVLAPFPAYYGTNTAADSVLIQEMCGHYEAEVFLSTRYTSPLRTPSVLLITDTPVDGYATAAERQQMEKMLAIHFARSLLCISANLREELIASLPWLQRREISVVDGDPSEMAKVIESRLVATREEAARGLHDAFLTRWSELRTIQAAVDF